MTTRAQLDAFIAAFNALDVQSADVKKVDMADRTDHIVIIGVSSYAALAELAIALDLPRPENHVEGGYAWWQSQYWPERGTSITIQAHRVGRNTAA